MTIFMRRSGRDDLMRLLAELPGHIEHEAKPLLSHSGQVREYVRFFSWPPSRPDLS